MISRAGVQMNEKGDQKAALVYDYAYSITA
jgi:hypothetical protein